MSSRGADDLVVDGWQKTSEARGYINALLKRNVRKQPGILERSALMEQFQDHPVLHYKLFLLGKSGIGKTSTVNKLCGRVISIQHEETLGVQTSTLIWPAKLVTSKKVVLFHIEFWDAGGRAVNKYDHILPTCKQNTDGIVFFFSYIDRHSWEELPSMISGSDSNVIKIIIGTHADSYTREVTQAEVHEFEEKTKLVVMSTANIFGKFIEDGKTLDGRAGIEEVIPLMTTLTQTLVAYEQQKPPEKNKLFSVRGEDLTDPPSQ